VSNPNGRRPPIRFEAPPLGEIFIEGIPDGAVIILKVHVGGKHWEVPIDRAQLLSLAEYLISAATSP
jgi:hypothetical protein